MEVDGCIEKLSFPRLDESRIHAQGASRSVQVHRCTPSLSPVSSRPLSRATPLRHLGRTLVSYASTPQQIRLGVDRPYHRRRAMTQLPLSALCSTRPAPGGRGNLFNSTTKVKCVPLPHSFSHHCPATPHGTRKVPLHTQRYMLAPTADSPVSPPSLVSHSLLNSKLPRQGCHLNQRETALKKSRSLQRARQFIPHRLNMAVYLNGEAAQLFNKEVIPTDELQTLEGLSLSQNPTLYYGAGIKSGEGHTPREVLRFEQRLKDAMEEVMVEGYEGMESQFNAGRSSRLSRTSPILEEGEEVYEPLGPVPHPQHTDTFLTDYQKNDQPNSIPPYHHDVI